LYLNKKNIFTALLFFLLKEGKSQYLGGINDGFAFGTINNCIPLALPSLTNNALGGINDGFALGTINNCIPIALPSLTNNALGGINDGFALGTINNCTPVALPSFTNNAFGGINDGLALGTINNCIPIALPSLTNNAFGGINDGSSTGTATCLFILPVELLEFKISCNGDLNVVQWTTESEKNNEFFTLERSFDTRLWEVLGTVKGAGTSGKQHNYQFNDALLLTQTAYYRLKQNNFDGSFSYSEIITQSPCGEGVLFLLYPNPSTDEFILTSGPKTKGDFTFEVINVLGEIIYRNSFTNRITFGTELFPGVYFIRVYTSGYINKKFETKFIKTK